MTRRTRYWIAAASVAVAAAGGFTVTAANDTHSSTDGTVIAVHGDTFKDALSKNGWGDRTPGNTNIVLTRIVATGVDQPSSASRPTLARPAFPPRSLHARSKSCRADVPTMGVIAGRSPARNSGRTVMTEVTPYPPDGATESRPLALLGIGRAVGARIDAVGVGQ